MDIKFAKDRPIQIDALVLTQKTVFGADAKLQKRLEQSLGGPSNCRCPKCRCMHMISLVSAGGRGNVRTSAATLAKRMQNSSESDLAAIAAAEAQVRLLDVSVDGTNIRPF